MENNTTQSTEVTIGLDIGDKRSHAVVLDSAGEWTAGIEVKTTQRAMASAFAGHEGAQVVLEVGTHSPWISRILEDRGFQVTAANPRRVRLIAEAHKKNDRVDAEFLARLGRVDPELLAPVAHRSEQAQQDLTVIRARDGLVKARTALVQQARGLSKSLGYRIPSCSTASFPTKARLTVTERQVPGITELLESIETLTVKIRALDSRIKQIAATRYPVHECLTQIPGVGTLTALSFVLVIHDPARFKKSRDVAAYLGLVPRQRQSGERQQELGITKRGDADLRRLLVGSAHYILNHAPDSDLRRFGHKLIERGGAAARQRAAVAVARKLAVLMHRLWVAGEVYEPIGYTASGAHLMNSDTEITALAA